MTLYTADRRLWLTADQSRVVEDGDPEAAFQLLSPGQTMATRDAVRYGLVEAEVKEVAKPADKAVGKPRSK